MMAEGVVDLLEPIEVDQKQGERTFAGSAVKASLQLTLKMGAIGQAGQSVVRGLVRQLDVLSGQMVVDGQNALGDFQAQGQFIRAGRLGKEVVGAGA